MVRRLALVASALALAMSGVALTAVSASAAAPVDASGTLHCSITGKVKIAPKLLFGGGTPGGSLFLAKVKSTSCTGTSGVTSVKSNFTARLSTNDCIALATQPFPAATLGPAKFKGVGKYTKSTTDFTAGGTFSTTDPITLSVPGAGVSSIASGSFMGQQPTITFVFDQSAASLGNACQAHDKDVPGSGGLKKLTFSGSSSLDIN
jgi:hypothetical protein